MDKSIKFELFPFLLLKLDSKLEDLKCAYRLLTNEKKQLGTHINAICITYCHAKNVEDSNSFLCWVLKPDT